MARLKKVVTFAIFSLLFGSKIVQSAVVYDSATKVQLNDGGDFTFS